MFRQAVIGLAAFVALALVLLLIVGAVMGPQPGRGPLTEPSVLYSESSE